MYGFCLNCKILRYYYYNGFVILFSFFYLNENLKPVYSVIFKHYQQNLNALRAYYFVFEVMKIIFHYDLVLIRLNDKIIR